MAHEPGIPIWHFVLYSLIPCALSLRSSVAMFSVFGKPVAQQESLQAVRSLEHHIVHVLGAESLDRWRVEVRLSTEYSLYSFEYSMYVCVCCLHIKPFFLLNISTPSVRAASS